jgi:hypothetical protein
MFKNGLKLFFAFSYGLFFRVVFRHWLDFEFLYEKSLSTFQGSGVEALAIPLQHRFL